jgi:hypothetical protein
VSRVTEERVAGPRERRSPGLAALFGALAKDGRHSVLDLGGASGAHLRLLTVYASQVRFASLLGVAGQDGVWDDALRELPPNPARPYDVVLAWDVLDRLDPERRVHFVARLGQLTAARARLYAIAGGEGAAGTGRVDFTLLGPDRVEERPADVTTTTSQPLLPAQMERVLAPFEVVSAFMLRTGAREYVAVKRP